MLLLSLNYFSCIPNKKFKISINSMEISVNNTYWWLPLYNITIIIIGLLLTNMLPHAN